MPTPAAMSLRAAPDARQLLGAPDLAQVARQHELDAQRRLAVAQHVGEQGERARHVAGADRLGQLEDAALARLGDQILDGLDADRLVAGVERQLIERLRQAAEVGAGGGGQRLRGVGGDGQLARARLGAHPAGERLVAQRREDVQVAALLQRLERLEADVDLVGDQEEAGGRVRVLERRRTSGSRSAALTSSIALPTTSRRLASIGSVRAVASAAPSPFSLRSKTSWLKEAAAPAAARTAVRMAAAVASTR